MSPLMIKQKVLQEIDLLPEDKLMDIYNFIHHFRLGAESIQTNQTKPTMAFAGCWSDMPEDEFAAFTSDIDQRRSRN